MGSSNNSIDANIFLTPYNAEGYRKLGDYQLNIKKDKQKAFHYYALGEKDWRDEYCRYQLALLHLDGVYAHPSIDRVLEAIRLLEMNAKKGHWKSCKQLGIIYYDEDYGEQDLDKALDKFKQAADIASESEPSEAQEICYFVGNLFRKGKHFQDYKQALVWYERAVNLSHIDSLYFMALIYHEGGFGVQQNIDEVLKFYVSASAHEEDCNYYAEAANALGDIYRYGEGDVQIDYEEAFEWYLKSAQSERMFKECLLNLATMHEQGLGVEKDPELARIWTALANEDD